MSAEYTRLGQLEGEFGVPAREYLTARDFGGHFTYEKFPSKSRAVRYSLAGTPSKQLHCLTLISFSICEGPVFSQKSPAW